MEERAARQDERIARLERQAQRSSRSSSQPPSQDPPGASERGKGSLRSGLGVEKQLGEHGLRICDEVFWAWEIFQHTGDRRELKRRVRVLRRELKPLLREHAGTKARYRQGRRFARNVLKVWPGLWTFAEHAGVCPPVGSAHDRWVVWHIIGWMPGRADVGLSNCRVVRPGGFGGGVEIVVAHPAARSFPMRVSAGLGICVKVGGTHDVSVDGRWRSYPADSVSVRAPGCVWASGDGVHGFVSVDIDPKLLPEDCIRGSMAFVGRHAVPDVGRLARRLTVAEDELHAGELIAEVVEAAAGSGAMQIDSLRDAIGSRGAVDDAREFLASELTGRPTLEAAAAAAGVSKFTLLRRFRRALGTTPHAYLVMLRLARAQQLLAGGATPAEAAAAAGFADQAHLGRWFRRSLGVTPASYAR